MMSVESTFSNERRESSSSNIKEFDPVAYELEPKFRLTSFSGLKGRAWKVPQASLQKMLQWIQEERDEDQDVDENSIYAVPNIEIGMDCSVTPFRYGGLSLVQTTNLIYALVNDPYMQGKIACANVLSNLYAMGVTECDNVLMILGVSIRMTQKERDVIMPLIMRGFKDCALKAGTEITGGETNINPWLTIGGVATAICQPNEFLVPNAAVPGDVLIITKPLGTQVALTANLWMDEPDDWNRIKLIISKEDTKKAYQRALDSMGRLNRAASTLMHKYYAHGATDVSGFGLLGHAQALARNQVHEVSFVIHNLPIIAKMSSLAKSCESMFQLHQGRSAEISGGLLICLPKEKAVAFCKDILKMEGCPAWIIGVVEKGHRTARIIERPRVIEVPSKETPGD